MRTLKFVVAVMGIATATFGNIANADAGTKAERQ